MMGNGHATTGAAMWAGTVVLAAPHLAGIPMAAPLTTATIVPIAALAILGAAPVTGASVFPDIDHTNGTIANSMGSVTKLLTKIVSVISGGHRQATHGIWFWAVVTAAAFSVHFAAVNAPSRPDDGGAVGAGWSWFVAHGDLFLFFMLTAFGQRALGAKWLNKVLGKVWRGATRHVVGGVFFLEAALLTVLAALVWPQPEQWIWLPVAISVGHLSHLIADTMTTAGVMWLWPKQTTLRVPIIGDAGSVRETIWSAVVGVLFLGCAAYAFVL